MACSAASHRRFRSAAPVVPPLIFRVRRSIDQGVQFMSCPEPRGAGGGSGLGERVIDCLVQGHIRRLSEVGISGATGNLDQAAATEPPAVTGGLIAIAHAIGVDPVGKGLGFMAQASAVSALGKRFGQTSQRRGAL
jgi:hypothetical protein